MKHAADQLLACFSDAVCVQYFDLLDPNCPTLPDGVQLPLVLLNGEVFTSGARFPWRRSASAWRQAMLCPRLFPHGVWILIELALLLCSKVYAQEQLQARDVKGWHPCRKDDGPEISVSRNWPSPVKGTTKSLCDCQHDEETKALDCHRCYPCKSLHDSPIATQRELDVLVSAASGHAYRGKS